MSKVLSGYVVSCWRTLSEPAALRCAADMPIRHCMRTQQSNDCTMCFGRRNVTYLAVPGSIIFGVYTLLNEQHHEHHKIPDYPYLRIRSKEFPCVSAEAI